MKWYLVFPTLDMFTITSGVYVDKLECKAESVKALFNNLRPILEDNEICTVLAFDDAGIMDEYASDPSLVDESRYEKVFVRYTFGWGGESVANEYPL